MPNVTHSLMLAYPGTKVLELKAGGISVAGTDLSHNYSLADDRFGKAGQLFAIMFYSPAFQGDHRMSRLDSFIKRLTAQRDCLALAASLIADKPGPVLEVGLGNGRTFDHLRALLPGREIFAFDRQLNAHPHSTPDAAHLFLGEFAETLPTALAQIGAPAALIHADFGSGDAAATAATAVWLGPALARLLASGGIVAADQPLAVPGWVPLPLPPGVSEGRYFLYRG